MGSVTFADMTAIDLLELVAQPTQQVGFAAPCQTLEHATELAENGRAWSARVGGRLLVCAGLTETFPGKQGVAWAILAENKGVAMHAITRFARWQIVTSPLRRIEAIVRGDDPSCAAWARMVGLRFRTALEAWGPDSETHLLFERVR